MHGGVGMHELPICEVIDHFAWRVVAEEWSGEDAYAANQSIEDLIDWQLAAAKATRIWKKIETSGSLSGAHFGR